MSRERYKLRPKAARETSSAEFGSFFHIVNSSEGDRCAYPARLDTYGCAHDCSYCYAKSLLDFRGRWNPRAPLAADMAKIRALIPSLRGAVRLGGMTDCFQPSERRVRNTYKTINLLNAAGVPYLIVTKSALVAAPEYLALYDPQLAHVQVSVTATSDEGGRARVREGLTDQRAHRRRGEARRRPSPSPSRSSRLVRMPARPCSHPNSRRRSTNWSPSG